MKTTIAFPSPRRGPIFSTYMVKFLNGDKKGFRPHEGDPSSLQDMRRVKAEKEEMVSVPTKGTHLLYPVRAIHEFSHNYSPLFVVKENRYYFHWSLS